MGQICRALLPLMVQTLMVKMNSFMPSMGHEVCHEFRISEVSKIRTFFSIGRVGKNQINRFLGLLQLLMIVFNLLLLLLDLLGELGLLRQLVF
jgi:hypothetical protein